MNYFIQHLRKAPRVSVMIRHAERYPIKSMHSPGAAMLTDKGKDDARDLGRRIASHGPFLINHSPIPRCMETAHLISSGIDESAAEGNAIAGNVMPELAGPFKMGDWNKIAEISSEIGMLQFLRKWFDGEYPENLILPLKNSAEFELNMLANQLRESKTSVINVTHDWNIIVLTEFYFGLKHEDIGPPPFLDVLTAFTDNEAVHLLYGEREIKIEL